MWSNASGAQLFGGNGIAELLAMQIPQTNPLVRQLHHAIEQMGDERSIIRGFQINQGMRSQLLQFSIELVEGDLDEHAYKVTHLPGDVDERPSQGEINRFTVEAFEGLASAAGILDRSGITVARSSRFDDLAPETDERTTLIEQLASEEDRLIKRPIRLKDGTLVVVGLARLGEGLERNLMVLAEPLEQPGETDGEETVIERTEPLEEPASPTEHEDTPPTDEGFTETEIEPLTEAEDDQLVAIDEEQDEIVRLFEGTSGPQEEKEDTPSVAVPATGEATRPAVVDAGTRFAWSVDQDGFFTSVSDEMALLFGRDRKALVGKSWDSIATEYGLDPEGEIASLLEKRDTWSGKIVHWPLEDDGGEVAIELAALPAFDTDRVFSGFKGFGKVLHRVTPSAVEEEASNFDYIESATTFEAAHTDEPDLIISSPIESEEEDGTENVAAVDEEQSENSNIVPFSRGGNAGQDLTEVEQEALRAVREHLSEDNDIADLQQSIIDANSVEPSQHDPEQDDRPNTYILERLPVAVLVYRDEAVLYANRAFLEVSGQPSLETLKRSRTPTELIGGEVREDGSANTLLHMADGDTKMITPTLHTVPWGEEKAVLLSFSPPLFEEPDAIEITRVAEIQSILDTTNDGIILMEPDGRILSINASAEALFGIEFDDAIGKPLQALFAPESHTVIRGYVANVIEDGVERLINDGEEAIALEANGGIIPVFVTIAKMQSSGKLCAVLRDITNWKKAEEELIQSRKEAETSNEQKSEFLAKVSHEIRTPLNAIIGFSDVMIEERFGPIDNDRYREYLRDIKRSGSHVLDIVNELLDLSRIEAGKLELTFEAVSLNEVVAETVALLQPEANTNRTIIRTSLSRSVPKIVADPRSIRQIILNLVSNAIKYSRSNSQVIVSTVYETNGEVALRVRDTGDGMTDEQIEEALKPFRQAHDLKDNTIQGSGLGLPLTKALVEANRAYFDLESEPGLGTIAHVLFPVQRVLSE